MSSISHFNKLLDRLPGPFDWITKLLLHLFVQKHLLSSYYVLETILGTSKNEINQQKSCPKEHMVYCSDLL